MAEHEVIVWCLTVGQWVAVTGIATAVLAFATIALAWVAWYQIGAARTEARAAHEEDRKRMTLEIVSKYDHDPVLDRALRRMANARDSGEFFANARKYRTDLVAVMNYFETIAIGVQQGIFIKEMVRDFMEPIFRSHIQEIEKHGLFDKIGTDSDEFAHICALDKSWRPKLQQMHFKGDSHV